MNRKRMKPLCLPQTNWPALIGTCQDVLGYSPTRGLDDGIFPKHNDPAAILGCLDLENKPQQALRKKELQRHYHLSFVGELNSYEILLLTNYTGLNILHKGSRHDAYVVVLSATLDVWIEAVNYGCSNEADETLRQVMNNIYNHLSILGFKSAILGSKKEHADGTFILV